MRHKKILILSNDTRNFYLMRYELILAMLNGGNSVYIAASKSESQEELSKSGCTIIELTIDRRGVNIFRDILLLLRYRKIIKKIHPDLIFTFNVKPNIYGCWMAGFYHIPSIVTITGLGTPVQNKGILQNIVLGLYRCGLKRAQKVFFQNRNNCEILLKKKIVRKEQVVMVPGSGVNLSRHPFEPYPKDNKDIRLLFIGRLMRDKGITELFDAAERIRKKYPFVHFDVLGKSEEDYSEQIQYHVIHGTVHYHEYTKDVHRYIADSHAVILPSYHEGMANVLLEASATGRPVLASRIPGCQETFDEGVTGFGFEPKNVDDLCRVIERFIQLPHSQKAEMGRKAREKMEREFDRRQVTQAYMDEIAKASINSGIDTDTM